MSLFYFKQKGKLFFFRTTDNEIVKFRTKERKNEKKSFFFSTFPRQPFFELKGLRSDYGYDIVLTAKNAKGKSAETILHMYTLNGAEKHTGEVLIIKFKMNSYNFL